jgi:hypothetical protein
MNGERELLIGEREYDNLHDLLLDLTSMVREYSDPEIEIKSCILSFIIKSGVK